MLSLSENKKYKNVNFLEFFTIKIKLYENQKKKVKKLT